MDVQNKKEISDIWQPRDLGQTSQFLEFWWNVILEDFSDVFMTYNSKNHDYGVSSIFDNRVY